MKTADNRLIEWAINETQTKYEDEVSILLEHNTYCLEEDRGVRYVNAIISDSKKLIGLARTFIINGIGYDFNQVSWEHMERQAEMKMCGYCVLADADVIYAKNERDRQRFLYLQAKVKANLSNPQYMFERGLEWLGEAMDIYKTLMFEESLKSARKGGMGITNCLAMAVASFNQTYFKSFTQLDELHLMKHLPDCFIELYNKIVSAKSVSEIKSLSYDIIKTTRNFFKKNDIRNREMSRAPGGEPNYEGLAEWYQECSYYFRRIYHFCSDNNPDLALDGSCGLQTDLDELAKEFGLPDIDLLTNFDAENLPAFAETVRDAENCIVSILKSNNVRIDSYASVDEFISNNS